MSKRPREVLLEELRALGKTDSANVEEAPKLADKAGLTGLALSGGGIRSATFNLGVLEALKELGLLQKLDYLSTVSGGGYIGAWLSANCQRQHKAGAIDWRHPDAEWRTSIRHLQRYSNYLAPQLGFFSADTWSMAMVWLRNTMLVQAMVVLAIACAVMVPRILFPLFEHWHEWGMVRWTSVFLFLTAVVCVAGNQFEVTRPRSRPARFLSRKRWGISLVLSVPLWTFILLASAKGWFGFSPFGQAHDRDAWGIAVHAGFAVAALAGSMLLLPAAVSFLSGIAYRRGQLRKGIDPSWGTVRKWLASRLAMRRYRVARSAHLDQDQDQVQRWIILPILASSFFVAAVLWGDLQPTLGGDGSWNASPLSKLDEFGKLFTAAWRYWPFPLAVVFGSLWLLGFSSLAKRTTPASLAAMFVAPAAAMLILHVLLCAIVLFLQWLSSMPVEGAWHAYVWGPPAILFAFSLAIVTLIGMVGRQSTEGSREWWSRMAAWLGIFGLAWVVIATASVYAPYVLGHLQAYASTITGSWVATTIGGLLAGRSASTAGNGGETGAAASQAKGWTSTALELLCRVAPFVFIAGLVGATATAVDYIVRASSPGGVEDLSCYWQQLKDAAYVGTNWWVLAGCVIGLLLYSLRVDINEFSLNAFYRSRLVRCYLGATRRPGKEQYQRRRPQAFTNFDDCDDLAMQELLRGGKGGPFHIVNCALNLGGSGDLDVHTRHSANFVLTPLHCGSSYPSRESAAERPRRLGYIPTAQYGGSRQEPTLGQAISVSGAAGSPNMGFHHAPAVAFLMTVFNVRLGWWFPNPQREAVGLPSPLFSLRYLLTELFASANARSKFLAISDGGHFENLGAYELIRRRCRVIIIGDAECDPQMHFEGLGRLIRICQVDFGATIRIEVSSLAKQGSESWSSNRCAVGTIQYKGDTEPTGTLIYLKASMNGKEDTGIMQYKAEHPTFPHESTGNQFYTEDQFESYRSLGYHIAESTFRPGVDLAGKEQALPAIAKTLEAVWQPTRRDAAQFVHNSGKLMDFWNTLGGDQKLSHLDQQMFAGHPAGGAESRTEFYFGNQVLQLMENVYLDLKMDENWEHPDVKGWKQQFLVWSRSPFVREAWRHSGNIYGKRFAYFCRRRLNMPEPAGDVAEP